MFGPVCLNADRADEASTVQVVCDRIRTRFPEYSTDALLATSLRDIILDSRLPTVLVSPVARPSDLLSDALDGFKYGERRQAVERERIFMLAQPVRTTPSRACARS